MDLKTNTVTVCKRMDNIKTKAVVDADVIVPDTKPDICRILAVRANSVVNERYQKGDKLFFNGSVKFNILYVGEGDSNHICNIEHSAPFSHYADTESYSESGVNSGFCCIRQTSYEVKNSRKLSVSAQLGLESEIYISDNAEYIDGEDLSEKIPVQTAVIECDSMDVCKEEVFTISDTFSVPGCKSDFEVHDLNIRCDVVEVKTVNNKAVIKGNAPIQILYSSDDEISVYDTEIPFTEIADIESVSAESTVTARFEQQDYVCNYSVDDNGVDVELEFNIKATICGYNHSHHRLITDMYSPDYNFTVKENTSDILSVCKSSKSQTTVKDNISVSGTSVAKLHYMCSYASCNCVNADNNRVKTEGTLFTTVIFSDEEGALHSVDKVTPFDMDIPSENCSEGCFATADLNVINCGYILSSSTEIQIRAVIKGEAFISSTCTCTAICEFSVDENNPISKNDRPGIVIYYPKKGDTLWDIAKLYSTTCDELTDTNSLESGELQCNKPILIPKHVPAK